ncbi:MAG: sulfatase-like hydrolase/transferase [Actinomycetota bacterium]|nr:sulfatase-like hydrolase/transferase [Actinomycetota bacterium]
MFARRDPDQRLATAACALLLTIAVAVALLTRAAEAPAAPGPAATSGKAKGQGKKKRSPKLSKEKKRRLREANRRQQQPNVIVIMTDDQNDDMTGLSNVTRLIGSRGTTFTNSYVSFPLCCPSRATLLSGQYAHNHGVVSTELPNGYNGLDHTNTLATWLRAVGYNTVMVGKYLNGYGIDDGIPERKSDAKEIPPGWSEWYALTDNKDQRRYRYRLNENGRIHFYGTGRRNYVTDVLADKAVAYVKRRAPRPKPFFLWFNPSAPHGEAGRPPGSLRNPTPAPRHLGRFNDLLHPDLPSFNEEDVSDKPEFIEDQPELTAEEITDMDLRYRGRAESLLSVDDAVKRLFGRLRKARDLGKTYVFFTSDNGLMLGAHRLLFKDDIYEEATNVPLLVRGPRFPQGVSRDQFVSNVDLAPTIVELTDALPGRTMDGRSLVAAADDPAAGRGRSLLFESERAGGNAAIRSGDFIYTDNGPDFIPELYDLVNDPYQLQNLQGNPLYLTRKLQLAAQLAQIRRCSGASCP